MSRTAQSIGLGARLGLARFFTAAAIYAGFAVYLYLPHLRDAEAVRSLVILNACLGSVGCFVLSRRWVAGFWGSFFAGAIYGFGPFALSLAGNHAAAGLLAAVIPWLFCPAAARFTTSQSVWRWLSVPLSVLPFLAIPLFFLIDSRLRLFAIPLQSKLQWADLASLAAPVVMSERSTALVGFYHVPVAALVMGFSMLLAARRFGIMLIFSVGIAFALSDYVLETAKVSPVMWLTIPVLCCSVLVGVGIHALTSSSRADRIWVLLAALVVSVLALVTLLMAVKYESIFANLGGKYAGLLLETARMYLLGAVSVAIIFFMARARLRLRSLRLVILGAAMAVDIFLGARFIVDKTF